MDLDRHKNSRTRRLLVVDGASNQDRTDDPRFTRSAQSATFGYLCDKMNYGKWVTSCLYGHYQKFNC
nr:MAG TPA: hypothetical protein [Caudoviricetes sp.]